MLNTGAGTRPPGPAAPPAPNPFAPRPTPSAPPGPVDLQADPDMDIGADTAIVRIAPLEPASSTPAPPAPAPVSAAPVAAPAPAPAPMGLDLGGDLFAAPKPTPAPAPAAAPVQAAAPVFAETRRPGQPEPTPQAGAEFAHPLHQGAYREAAAPVDLSAAEEEALASFEGKQAGVRPIMAISMTLGAALITAVFGFAIGNNRSVRQRINQQIDASIMVKDRMLPVLERLNEVAPIIEALAAGKSKVDWAKNNAIPTDLPDVQGGFLLSTPVPLEQKLSKNMARAVADLQGLFLALNYHRTATMNRDKAELNALEKGDSFAQFQQYAVYSKPRDPKDPAVQKGIPPSGRVVALVGKAEARADGEGYAIPIRKRESEQPELVVVEGITLLPKTDLLGSGKANALTEYTRRVEDLKNRLDSIKPYRKALEEQLKMQASREKVFAL